MKSSEIKQKSIFKRLAIYSRDLPSGADFGNAPYPVITSQWNDPQVGNQIVTSTYNGTDVYHWVAIGANQSNGNLDSWDIDGVYKQVLRSSDLLDEYFTVTSRKVGLKNATSQSHGVVKVGSTITVDADGEINVAISPTSIPIVADELARLALPLSTGAQLAIQQDDGFTYGLEANLDPSIALNWKKIGTAASSVVSFNGRIGGVTPQAGDYTQDKIHTVQDDTGDIGYFGANDSGIYLEMGGKIYLAKQQDLSVLTGLVDDHENDINNPTDGLKIKSLTQGNSITALQSTIYAPTSGLSDRVPALEEKTEGLSYDSNTRRISQTNAPTATASDEKDVLTKKDGDALYTNNIGAQVSGEIRGSDGAIVSTSVGSAPTVTRTGVGRYTISGLPSINVAHSMVYIESLTDGDNLCCVHNKDQTSFQVAFRDAPDFADQDTNFRYQWIRTHDE